MKTSNFIFIVYLLLLFQPGIVEAQWERTDGPYEGNVYCFTVNGTTLFAGTYGGGIFRSTDIGLNWSPVNTGITDKYIRSLFVYNSNIYAGTQHGRLYLSTDNGESWIISNTGIAYEAVTAFAAIDTNLFAGTTDGVYLSTDNGANWTLASIGLTNTYIRSLAVVGTNLFAGTSEGVFLTTNFGTSWTLASTGLPDYWIDALVVYGTTLFAGTSGDGVYFSTNNGDTWNSFSTGLTTDYISAFIIQGPNLYAGTSSGGVYSVPATGGSWTSLGLSDEAIQCFAVSGTQLFVGTTEQGIYVTTTSGSTWDISNTGLTNTYINDLVISGSNLFAGSQSGVFRTQNNGISWDKVNNGLTNTEVQALAVIGTNLFAGTNNGKVFVSENNGDSWTSVSTGLPSYTVDAFAVSGTNLYAGIGGYVYVSPDNGQTWNNISTGLPGTKSITSLVFYGTDLYAGTWGAAAYYLPEGATSWNYVYDGMIGSYITDLAVNETKLYASTAYGGVYILNDEGTAWTRVSSGLPSNSAEALYVYDTNLFVSILGMGAYLLEKNGESWSDINEGWSNVSTEEFIANDNCFFAGTRGEGVWERRTCSIVSEPDPDNILKNGNFSSCLLLPWELLYTDYLGVHADIELLNGECTIGGITLATEPAAWHIKLDQPMSDSQLGSLEQGRRYELSFDAYSETEDRQCRASFEQSIDPWTNFLDGNVLLGTSYSSYSFQFGLDTVLPDMQLSLQFGMESASAIIDNVKLKQKTSQITVPGTIQAEEFNLMNGIEIETTSDAGGGSALSYIDNGDWMEYAINVPQSGAYTIKYRIAGVYNGYIGFAQNGETLSNLLVPSTGGWQTWTTISTMVNLTEGIDTIRLTANTDGWNINWWSVKEYNPISLNPSESSEIQVFPNPVSDYLNILANEGSIVKLYNELGILISELTMAKSLVKIDMSTMPKGIYIVEIRSGKTITLEKVVAE